ncbi:MAG: hypothetical protein AAF589_06005, partial [Planctomycetota bacterium]
MNPSRGAARPSPRGPSSRRGFLAAGVVGGLGINLADFFSIRQAQAEQNHYTAPKANAKSVIHIFLRGG